jgi:hypothetical protein
MCVVMIYNSLPVGGKKFNKEKKQELKLISEELLLIKKD